MLTRILLNLAGNVDANHLMASYRHGLLTSSENMLLGVEVFKRESKCTIQSKMHSERKFVASYGSDCQECPGMEQRGAQAD